VWEGPEGMERRELFWVLALLALALILRIGYVLSEPRGFYFFDSVDYDRAAQSYLTTGSFDRLYDHLPLYPLMMATAYRMFGTDLLPLRLVQAILSLGICLCIWILGRRLFGERAGLLALAGGAVFPLHVVLPGIEYPVVLGTLLIWGALLFMAGREGGGDRTAARVAAAGVLAGLSAMTFEAGAGAAAFLLVWILLGPSFRGRRIRQGSVLVAAILLTLSPWLFVMSRSANFRPVLRRAAIHLPTAPGSDPPMVEENGANLLDAKLSGMALHPAWTVRYVGSEFFQFWNPYPSRLWAADPVFRQEAHRDDPRMLVDNPLVGTRARLLYAAAFAALLAAALAGAGVAARKVPAARFLAWWPVMLGVSYAFFFVQTRYRIPAEPAFLLLGAYAADIALQGALPTEIKASSKALWEGWKKIALKIAVVQTFILLFLFFILGLGPIALFMKLFRKDPMAAERQSGSFWVLRERTRETLAECLRQF
jgi:4-amino-4-deoxy-L-arabinose transferase-like glycosyltransferase